jgi:hypothetical protein
VIAGSFEYKTTNDRGDVAPAVAVEPSAEHAALYQIAATVVLLVGTAAPPFVNETEAAVSWLSVPKLSVPITIQLPTTPLRLARHSVTEAATLDASLSREVLRELRCKAGTAKNTISIIKPAIANTIKTSIIVKPSCLLVLNLPTILISPFSVPGYYFIYVDNTVMIFKTQAF